MAISGFLYLSAIISATHFRPFYCKVAVLSCSSPWCVLPKSSLPSRQVAGFPHACASMITSGPKFTLLHNAEIPAMNVMAGILLFVWNKCNCCYLCLSFRYYRNIAFVFAALAEVHNTINKCEERVVFADAHVLSWVVFRATLANDDVSCRNFLTAINLNAKSL